MSRGGGSGGQPCVPSHGSPRRLAQPWPVFLHSRLKMECTVWFAGALLDKYGNNVGAMS